MMGDEMPTDPLKVNFAHLEDFADTSSSPIVTCFSPAYLGFVASLSLLQELRNYRLFTSLQWFDAMKKELLALEQKQTWEVVPLADGKQAIGCKWVFKVKLKDDGSLDRYKVQLVAKGYSQVEGVDYTESFSLVVKVKAYLDSLFTIKDLRTPRYFLGLHIACLDLATQSTFEETLSGLLKTKKQYTVLRSSAEAEYHSMVATVYKLKWVSYLLRHFGVLVPAPIPLHCDNQAALHIMGNPVFMSEQSIWTLIVMLSMNCYKDSFIVSVSTRNKDQLADLFTKLFSPP
ncbi:hypothetical protein Sango_2737700 [Sesamum angolense]|uniref:Reverse transcriptase Ty1/copia-type domain-containing protein n=1 Tax=Sesamum angolense TaxID=2727404 RepID=A0AAE1W116_9LAMI|nr:hypothetical protein Sango_2737700 [Sesamum angolense]